MIYVLVAIFFAPVTIVIIDCVGEIIRRVYFDAPSAHSELPRRYERHPE